MVSFSLNSPYGQLTKHFTHHNRKIWARLDHSYMYHKFLMWLISEKGKTKLVYMKYNRKFINLLFGQTWDIIHILSYWRTSSFEKGVILGKLFFYIVLPVILIYIEFFGGYFCEKSQLNLHKNIFGCCNNFNRYNL